MTHAKSAYITSDGTHEIAPDFHLLAHVDPAIARRLLRRYLTGLSALLTRFEFLCDGCSLRLRGMVLDNGDVVAWESGHVAEVVTCRCLTCSEVVGTLCPIPMMEERHTNSGPMKAPRDLAPFVALEAKGWTQRRIAKKMGCCLSVTARLLRRERGGVLLTRTGRR